LLKYYMSNILITVYSHSDYNSINHVLSI